MTGTLKLRWWIGHDFLPKFYSQQWYNGLKDSENIYIENKMSILVGIPWMRQLRVKKSEHLFDCYVKSINLEASLRPRMSREKVKESWRKKI